jgi:hypothetical protein
MKGSTARSSDLEVTPPFKEINDLGVFGAMALLAMIQCGADPGYRYVRRLPARAARLAPHRALRHQIMVALLECGVLVPAADRRRRLDATLADPGWDLAELEDADWAIHWDDATRDSLPARLKEYLEQIAFTDHNREVLFETWVALATAECLAFAEHALTAHRMDSSIATGIAPLLAPVFAQHSIGQGCALMWWAAKNVGASFLRNGGAPGLAEREMMRSVQNAYDRMDATRRTVPNFTRHNSMPPSAFTGVFRTAFWSE